MANVLNGQFINWNAMTGPQIRAKVAELQGLAKLQAKAPEKAAAKIAKTAAKKVAAPKAAAKKVAEKPAAKKAPRKVAERKPIFTKPVVATGNRKQTTLNRIAAEKMIVERNMLAMDREAAIDELMSALNVCRRYAQGWLRIADQS